MSDSAVFIPPEAEEDYQALLEEVARWARLARDSTNYRDGLIGAIDELDDFMDEYREEL